MGKTTISDGGISIRAISFGEPSRGIWHLCSLLFRASSTCFLDFLIKGILKNKKESRKELSNPLIASVFTTFFMAGMILSTYILLFRSLGIWVAVLSKGVWWLSFIALIIHMAIFSWKYLRHFSMANLFPSWSVLYVGIGVASLTAPISGQFTIGKIVFWYGFIATLVLLPFLFIKAYKIGLPSAVKPNITLRSNVANHSGICQ